MPGKQEFLKLNLVKRSGKGHFRVFSFEDHGHIISYLPSLNLSAYAETKEEALKILVEVVLKDFFENLMQCSENKVFEELKSLGWVRNKILTRELSNNTHIDEKGILKNFNLSEETKIEEQLVEA